MLALIKFLSIGWILQSAYSQTQFLFSYREVATTFDNFPPSWSVTGNAYHSGTVGTYRATNLIDNPYHFSTFLAESNTARSNDSIFNMPAPKNCTIGLETFQTLMTSHDVFYFFVERGEYCVNNGVLRITHVNTTGHQINQVNTVSATHFLAVDVTNDPEWPVVLPLSNYGNRDVIMPFYTEGNDYFTLARAGVQIANNGAPLIINISRADFDFQLSQSNTASVSFDLSSLRNNTLTQWQYSPPFFIVASLSINATTVFIDIYKESTVLAHAQITIDSPQENLFYGFSLHRYSESKFLLYSRILHDQMPFLFKYLLYIISADGKVELLGDKASPGISSLVVLKKDHGIFLKEGVLVLDSNLDTETFNLTYFHPNGDQQSFLLPDSAWNLISLRSVEAVLVESEQFLHLTEIQRLFPENETGGWSMGWYDMPWAYPNLPATKPTATPTRTALTTSNNSFFASASARDSNNLNDRRGLVIGFTAGFLLLIATTSMTACLLIHCRRKVNYQQLSQDENINSLYNIQV